MNTKKKFARLTSVLKENWTSYIPFFVAIPALIVLFVNICMRRTQLFDDTLSFVFAAVFFVIAVIVVTYMLVAIITFSMDVEKANENAEQWNALVKQRTEECRNLERALDAALARMEAQQQISPEEGEGECS